MGQARKTINGTFKGELKTTGYGPRPIVEFDGPKPTFKNVGFNVFLSEVNRARVSNLPMEHSQNKNSFVGWVEGRYTDGQNGPVFLSTCPEDWNKETQEYDNTLRSLEG